MRERFVPMQHEHRMEHVATMGDVHWVNDSASVAVNGAWYALESLPGPIIWLAGGVKDGVEHRKLRQLVLDKVKAIYVFGENGMELVRIFLPYTTVLPCETMEEAVVSAHILAEPGDTVLMSPGMLSPEGYAERGDHFKQLVHRFA